MWDEYDEGTAFMPVISHKHALPQHDRYKFMALDEDGIDLPSDWYVNFTLESDWNLIFIQVHAHLWVRL